MSLNNAASPFWSRFNYIYCLDLIAFVCILVIANRPDGLAITVSALILGVGALVYRCVLGVKAKLETRHDAATRQRKPERQFDQRVRTAAPAPVAVPAKPGNKSWLRDSE